MNGLRQTRLVALREIRERSRSRAFRISLLLMVFVVAGVLILPAVLEDDGGAKDVGFAGAVPSGLPGAVRDQADTVGAKARTHRYDTVAAGQDALRDEEIDVLVVDSERLEWRRQVDDELRAVVAGAIQVVTVRDRAAAAGISPETLLAMVAPVPVEDVELGQVTGRSPDDETAAFVMTILLFMAIATYGAMVLSGVVEEKSSRVVEVLLARMPARNLLAGKIVGIGLLGLAQVALTALVALVVATAVDSVDLPSVRGSVLAWAVVWFVLGYALYATLFGALGSLASRTEDAQSVTGPVTVVMMAGYFVSFAAIGSPDAVWARLVSYLPPTAPLAMPNRIAMGSAAWWEPVVAVAVTLAAIAGLVVLGGRVYTGGILHTGPTLRLRDALGVASTGEVRSSVSAARPVATREALQRASAAKPQSAVSPGPVTVGVLAGAGVVVGAVVAFLLDDVVIGVAVAAGVYAAASGFMKATRRRDDRRSRSSP